MNTRVKVFVFTVVIGALGMLGYHFLEPVIFGDEKIESSDARDMKGQIRIGVDNWIGYFPLCSQNLKSRLASTGYLIQCEDDKADYAERFKKLKRGKLDFAVATADAYLLSGKKFDYPGTVVAVIDESKGGDAVIARADAVANINELRKKPVRIAFTPASPSEFLLKSMSVHFDVERLLRHGKWKVEADGSSEALKMLKMGEVEVAVLWEPEVTRALSDQRFKKLLSSRDTSQLIVDVLIVNRDFSLKHPEVVKLLLANYFRTLKFYRENSTELAKQVKKETGLKAKEVESMLAGVAWQTLSDNARRWFGISDRSDEALVNTIDSVVDVFKQTGDLTSHPLPDGNPYVIQNRGFIEELNRAGLSTEGQAKGQTGFKELSPAAWDKLEDVGTLKIRPISFQSGSNSLTEEGAQELKEMVRSLKLFPNFRVVIKGHTGLRGDQLANKKLSSQRAKTVKAFLVNSMKIDPNRLRALGLGSGEPLPRKPGESNRAYGYRLPRVELKLVSEVY